MMPKSRCSRTAKDETSHRACQTPGQLGTNARAGVANTARARQGTTMNHTPMSEETSREDLQDVADDDQYGRRGCQCANGDEDDKSGEAAVREDNIAAAPCRCNGEKSTDDVAMLRTVSLSTAITSGGVDHGQRHCGPRGRRSGNPKLDGVDA
uniref:Uncharacterized protein n=1 Tax=Oryza rufipogon TaxID=4529 RepID=A0A0E0REU7_ORYRU